ncbi:hypothetical protein SALBM135S_04637 [Streptomyces alboniger]
MPGPPCVAGSGGVGAAGGDDVAVLVRKFQRHSSQNGAFASRGVRHCGQSSASGPGLGTEARCGRPGAGCEKFGSWPGGGGG